MELHPTASYIVFECTCRKLYRIPIANFEKQNPFEFICSNCKRKIKCSCIKNRYDNQYLFEKIVDENLLDEINIE